MSKILNVDALKTEKKVVIKGKEFVVRSMTVAEFIEAAEAETKSAADESRPVAQTIKDLVDDVLKYVEGAERADLLTLDINQLAGLARFIKGADLEGQGSPQTPKSA